MAKRTKAMPGLRLAPVVQLKPEAASQALVNCLVELVAQAIKGEITGMVLAVMYSNDNGYVLKVVGEADDCPTYSLGMVEMLKADLVERVKNR